MKQGMERFVVRYYFAPEDFLEETISAHSREEAEAHIYHKIDPYTPINAPLARLGQGGDLCLFAKALVRYCRIRPAD
jgi:hypothetical protein